MIDRESLMDAMIAAYERNGERRYQGFYYCPRHVIRDLSKREYQVIWERYGSGDDYQAAHDAMMVEIKRLRFAAVLEAVLTHVDAELADREVGNSA